MPEIVRSLFSKSSFSVSLIPQFGSLQFFGSPELQNLSEHGTGETLNLLRNLDGLFLTSLACIWPSLTVILTSVSLATSESAEEPLFGEDSGEGGDGLVGTGISGDCCWVGTSGEEFPAHGIGLKEVSDVLDVSGVLVELTLELITSIDSEDSGAGFEGTEGEFSVKLASAEMEEVSDISELQLSIEGTISMDETSEERSVTSFTAASKFSSTPFSFIVFSAVIDGSGSVNTICFSSSLDDGFSVIVTSSGDDELFKSAGSL